MKRALLLLILTAWVSLVNSQNASLEIVSTAGETFKIESLQFQLDWTLGELAISNLQENPNLQITQGFHQPYYTVVAVDELPVELGQINVYPNPTSDLILMDLNFDKTRKVQIQCFDLTGNLLWTERKTGQIINASKSMLGLPPGSYFVNFLIDENLFSETFKIEKIH